jgi:hypothetical protein
VLQLEKLAPEGSNGSGGFDRHGGWSCCVVKEA